MKDGFMDKLSNTPGILQISVQQQIQIGQLVELIYSKLADDDTVESKQIKEILSALNVTG